MRINFHLRSERDNPSAYALLSVGNPSPCKQTLKKTSDIVYDVFFPIS